VTHLSSPGAIASSQGFVKLFDSTLGANTASIDSGAGGFSQVYDHLMVLIIARTTQAAVQSTITMQFNNDGGANYDTVRITDVASTVSGNTSLAQTAFTFSCVGANADAGDASAQDLFIPAYAQTTFHKTGTVRTSHCEDTAADNIVEMKSFRWRSTAAINRVAITAGSGSLLAGSRLCVYGF